MNQMDLDWSADGYHKLNVTFAYTYWQNNSLQALGMQLVDAGINAISSAVGGLGGNAVGSAGSGVNNFINDVSSTFRR
jgi:phage-related protein